MNIDDQLKSLPPSQADPSVLPSAADILQEKLDLLPAADLSLSELVEKLSKKKEEK